MAGVWVFAAEEEEAGHGAEATETHRHGDRRAEPGTTTEAGGGAEGDAAAGEAVFASAGCGGCHTLEAAGVSGAVGPNLDDVEARCRARRRPRHERRRGDAPVRRPAQRAADRGRRRVRGRVHAALAGSRIPFARPERCPSGRRSATGNRVSVERRFAGSNPALSASCARSESAGADSDRAKTPEGSLRSRLSRNVWIAALWLDSGAGGT